MEDVTVRSRVKRGASDFCACALGLGVVVRRDLVLDFGVEFGRRCVKRHWGDAKSRVRAESMGKISLRVADLRLRPGM